MNTEKSGFQRKKPQEDIIYGVRAVIEAVKAEREINKIMILKGMNKDLFMELKQALNGKNFQLQFVPVQKLDSLRADSLSKVLQKPYEQMVAVYSDMVAKKIKENASSFASIMAIQQIKPEIYLDVYQALDKGLSQKYPTNEDIKAFHGMVQQTEMMVVRTQAIKIGAEAPELILPMPNDKELSLSSLRGKIVLIDFWASWCGPCRKEMPNVKRCYEKYKNKGFEILGVSLDKDRAEWLEAISKDGLTWPQVSDLKFWQSEAVQTYAVQSIPYTVLIDKAGKIIATDLRGTELDKKLAEVLK
jgi:peroxiredoxin